MGTVRDTLAMKIILLLCIFAFFSCGMIEDAAFLTVKICGSRDCCLSRNLDNDNINWLPGQTDTFSGKESLLECADYELGDGPFSLTVHHDGVDGLTLVWVDIRTDARHVRCQIDHKLDDHSFLKSTCS